MDNLEKIDVLRDRMKVSYQEAKTALESSDWDVVDALVRIERDAHRKKEVIFVRGNELLDKVKQLIRKGNVTRIRVKQDETTLVELPITAGIVGAVLAPELAVVGAVAALVSRCKVEIERQQSDLH